jgi:serine/threonine protein kinase/Tfp pilus assembly protein PilF
MLGQTISHYHILEKLGEGGRGVVYKAQDSRLKRTVALKLLPPEFMRDPEAKERFLLEAQAAAALDHQNICNIHEVDEVGGQTFIVMSCVEGQNLKEKISRGPLKIDDVLNFAVQAAEGLQEAHEKGIIHRDIKSENIMVNENGQVKIMDFGLAKLTNQTRFTREGTTMGTVSYMSPEQTHGNDVDHRSDIWSFGIVLYEMVAGQLPFKGDYEQAVIYSILNEEPEPLTALCTGVPIELERIVVKALAKDPANRYQSITDMQIDLKRLKRATGRDSQISLARTARPVKGKPAAPFAWNKTGIALGIAICLIIIITWVLFREPFKKKSSLANLKDNSIAIMYFENMAQPEDKERLGDIIKTLLITDLSESRYVSVVSNQRMYDILKLMGKEGVMKVDRSVASEVATRAKSRWMLLGNILMVEPRIVITTQLVDVKSGRVEASQRVTGGVGQDVFPLVDRLAVEIRNDLALPAAAAQEPDRPVADVTTHSREAYRYYIEGCDYYYKYYKPEAIKSFRKAIEHDPTFAMAYYMLSSSYDATGGAAFKEKKEIFANAVKYSDKVSVKEKHLIDSLAASFSGKYTKAILILEKLLERFPDDKEIYFEIGNIYLSEQQIMGKAIYYFKKAIEIDPLDKNAYLKLHLAYKTKGDIEESIQAIDQYIKLAPNEAMPYHSRGYLYMDSGKIDQAIQSFKKACELKPLYSSWELGDIYLQKREYDKADKYYRELADFGSDKYKRTLGRGCLAFIPFHQGKYRETLEIADVVIASNRIDRIKNFTSACIHLLRAFVYLELNKPALGLKECDTGIDHYSSVFPGARLSWANYRAWFLGATGQVEKVNEIIRMLKGEQKKKDRTLVRSFASHLGWCELARGNPGAAIPYFKQAIKERLNFRDYYFLGKSCFAAGRLEEGIEAFEKAITRYDRFRMFFGNYSAKAHFLLGTGYEKSGRYKKAVENYERFLDIWKDADPGIKEIQIARERLAILKGKAGK